MKLEIAANALPNMNFEEERETLAKVERHIAEARKYIARQRVLVQNVVDKGELSIEAKSTHKLSEEVICWPPGLGGWRLLLLLRFAAFECLLLRCWRTNRILSPKSATTLLTKVRPYHSAVIPGASRVGRRGWAAYRVALLRDFRKHGEKAIAKVRRKAPAEEQSCVSQRRSSNANSLQGQNSAGFPQIYADLPRG